MMQARYTGILTQHAQARGTMVDGGGHVPVLCMDVELDTSFHNILHVEQVFPVGHYTQCEAAARRLKKGTRVSVDAPLDSLRLVARNAAHIHVHKDAQCPQ